MVSGILLVVVHTLLLLTSSHAGIADSVLDRHVEAVGGESRIAQIRTMVVSVELDSPLGISTAGR